MKQTKEPQYNMLFDVAAKYGISSFGLMANESWNQDPRRTLFTLARYKFVAKMLSGKRRVLEIGCADAFGTRLVQQEVEHVTALDFDPVFVADAQRRMNEYWPFECVEHDMVHAPFAGDFDAAYSLDVIEHIAPTDEPSFLRHVCASLTNSGIAVIGAPSLESQRYASEQSRAGHVNCKTGADFKRDLERYFCNVFLFSMNDEVVHTGFSPMAHYLIALCCGVRDNTNPT